MTTYPPSLGDRYRDFLIRNHLPPEPSDELQAAIMFYLIHNPEPVRIGPQETKETLFGYPIVYTDDLPKMDLSKIIIGRWETK